MLPRTCGQAGIVARLGLIPDGEVVQHGVPFLRYRLSRRTWAARAAP
jgi:hypothetical protein